MLLPLTTAQHTIALTQQNFEHRTKGGTWLLNFHAPWCAHCKQLAPVYERVAQHYHTKDRAAGVHVAKVDATQETALAQRFSITGYPTVVLFHQGKVFAYSGDRSFDDLIRFVDRHKTKKAASAAADAATSAAGVGLLSERAIAAAQQIRDRVRNVFLTLTVAEVAWGYFQLGATLSAAIFVAIASIHYIEQRAHPD